VVNSFDITFQLRGNRSSPNKAPLTPARAHFGFDRHVLKAVGGAKLPTNGMFCLLSRATSTGMKLNPRTARFVGSKPIQQVPDGHIVSNNRNQS